MDYNSSFIIKDNVAYIAIEPSTWSRETANLELAILLAREKIKNIENQMNLLEDDTDEYDDLQDKKNDLEFLVDDFNNRFEILLRAKEVLKSQNV